MKSRKIVAVFAAIFSITALTVGVLPTGTAAWATASSDTPLRTLFPSILKVERENDDFVYWPLEKKIDLMRMLVGFGYMETTEDIDLLLTNNLPEETAHAAVDEAMALLTHVEPIEINAWIIVEALFGPFAQWSKEDQAWHTQLMIELGLQGKDHPVYLVPTGAIDEMEAIQAARKEVASAYGVEESTLLGYDVVTSFQVPGSVAMDAGEQAYWYVEFSAPTDLPEEDRVFYTAWEYIHPESGEPLGQLKMLLEETANYSARFAQQPYADITSLREAAGGLELAERTLEQKAEYSQKIKPQIEKMLAENDLSLFTFDGEVQYDVIATAHYTYGLPGKDHLSQARALEIASALISDKWGWDAYTQSLYNISVFFDTTDPNKPLWRFVFIPDTYKDTEKRYAVAFQDCPRYRVEVNATDGTVTQSESFPFAWMLFRSLEEGLKYY